MLGTGAHFGYLAQGSPVGLDRPPQVGLLVGGARLLLLEFVLLLLGLHDVVLHLLLQLLVVLPPRADEPA